jgi:hypothetical protein
MLAVGYTDCNIDVFVKLRHEFVKKRVRACLHFANRHPLRTWETFVAPASRVQVPLCVPRVVACPTLCYFPTA